MSEHKNSFNEARQDMVDRAFADSENQINEKSWNEAPVHEFSDDHNKKMKKLFDKMDSGKSRTSFNRLGLVACILILIVAGSSIAISNVDALRGRFLNFVLDPDNPNTDFSVGEDDGQNYTDDYILMKYVPTGFNVEQTSYYSVQCFWGFECKDKYFHIITFGPSTDFSVDTEDATFEDVTVQGREAVYSSNERLNSLIFEMDGKGVCVLGNIEKAEILRIAENLTFIQ